MDECNDELGNGGDSERGDGPGDDGDGRQNTLDPENARTEHHCELVRDGTQGPTLALRQEDLPVLGNDGESLGTESLGSLSLREEGEEGGGVDGVLGVDAHDLRGHRVVGLGAVSEFLAKD